MIALASFIRNVFSPKPSSFFFSFYVKLVLEGKKKKKKDSNPHYHFQGITLPNVRYFITLVILFKVFSNT